jgi:Spy/CpxP family protein refolding chaperone
MFHTSWAQRARGFGFQPGGSCGSSGHWAWKEGFMRGEGFEGGFGVRRPLRFLADKLDLDEKQIADLARILDEVKTERAQAEVDNRRTLGEFADSLSSESFDAAKATSAGERRVASAARLRDAIVKSMGQIHAILNPQQRAKLAYLIRAGVLGL